MLVLTGRNFNSQYHFNISTEWLLDPIHTIKIEFLTLRFSAKKFPTKDLNVVILM